MIQRVRPRLVLGFLLFAVTFASGCVFWNPFWFPVWTPIYHVYLPNDPALVLNPGRCGTTLRYSSKSVAVLKGDAGVEIRIDPGAYASVERDLIYLNVWLLIPEGASVQLLSPSFFLESPEWKQQQVLNVSGIRVWPQDEKQQYLPTALLPGASRAATWGQKMVFGMDSIPAFYLIVFENKSHYLLALPRGTFYSFFLQGIGNVPWVNSSFTLTLPPMLINNTEFHFASVRFDHSTSWC